MLCWLIGLCTYYWSAREFYFDVFFSLSGRRHDGQNRQTGIAFTFEKRSQAVSSLRHPPKVNFTWNVCSLDRLWSKSSLVSSFPSVVRSLSQKVLWVGSTAALSRDVFVTDVCSWEYKFVKFIHFASVSGGNQTWATCAGSERFALFTVVSKATLKQAAETWSAKQQSKCYRKPTKERPNLSSYPAKK